MTWFTFTCNDPLGDRVCGQHHSDSELDLISRLHAIGMTQVSIQKMSFLQTGWHAIKAFASQFVPVRKLDLSIFYYQLADMLEIGIPLKQALLVIANHLQHPKFIRIIHHIVAGLSKGLSFAEALHQHKRLFSVTTLQLIALAHTKEELTGILRYCDQSMRRMTFVSKLLFVVLPQISITVILFLILLFIRFHYLSSFYYALSIFRNPVPVIIHVFDIFTGMLTVNLLRTIGLVAAFFILCRLVVVIFKKARFIFDAFLYFTPIVGGVIAALERERLSLLYSVLLKGGSSVQQCAQYSTAVVRNLFFKHRVQAMALAIYRGDSFSSVLKYFHIFGAAEVQMIALGATSNSLVKTFSRLYAISQMMLERKLMVFLECIRFLLYLLNITLVFFIIFVIETLFFYPGAH